MHVKGGREKFAVMTCLLFLFPPFIILVSSVRVLDDAALMLTLMLICIESSEFWLN